MSDAHGADLVLCINGGSSSLKFALHAMEEDARAIVTGAVEGVGDGCGRAWISGERPTERRGLCLDHASALEVAFSLLRDAGAPPPTLVGHRVVHGGSEHTAPRRVDAALLGALRSLVPLAPLHMPSAIACIEGVTRRAPELPQVACFDTAFHASMPELARRLPLPDDLHREGVRRYGFHGLSFEHVMATLGPAAPPRVVIAHLGSGSSLVAVKDGLSIETTMGFTPAGGILMGTRPGDLDPGVLLYLLREKKLSIAALERLVEHESGLSSIGGTSDMKALLERAPLDPRAELAVSMFGYAVRKAIGGLTAALGGIDVLVFTGGIGEHAPRVRADACAGLASFGVRLDAERNARGSEVISEDKSPCVVRVIPADEGLVIARHTRRVVRGG
jgi:acetate kinase